MYVKIILYIFQARISEHEYARFIFNTLIVQFIKQARYSIFDKGFFTYGEGRVCPSFSPILIHIVAMNLWRQSLIPSCIWTQSRSLIFHQCLSTDKCSTISRVNVNVLTVYNDARPFWNERPCIYDRYKCFDQVNFILVLS